jgi:predicted nucleotidyltransferase
MNAVDRSILSRFKALLQERLPVRQVILFGSRARGDADPQSDMDVVVVLEGTVDHRARDYVSDCAWEAGFEAGIVVVPLVYSVYDWEEGPESASLLARAVALEGLPV